MMTSIFILWFVVTTVAWIGFRRWAMTLFAITLVVASVWFNHHLTSAINIQL